LNNANLNWFYSIADSTFRSGNYEWHNKNIPDGYLFSFATKTISNTQFCDYISIMGKRAFSRDSLKYINTLLDLKSFDEIIKYEDSILEDKYPEFRYLMHEFYDGILLFEISDQKIWKHLNGESESLKEYWESQKGNYMTEPEIEAEIYTISKSVGRKKGLRMARDIKKSIKSGASKDEILEIGRTAGKSHIKETSGLFSKGENRIIDNIKWETGLTSYSNNDGTHIVNLSSVIEAEYIPYEEAIPLLIDDYKKKIENDWFQQLEDKFSVTINESALRQIKA